jgi:hypothetical protein
MFSANGHSPHQKGGQGNNLEKSLNIFQEHIILSIVHIIFKKYYLSISIKVLSKIYNGLKKCKPEQ